MKLSQLFLPAFDCGCQASKGSKSKGPTDWPYDKVADREGKDSRIREKWRRNFEPKAKKT